MSAALIRAVDVGASPLADAHFAVLARELPDEPGALTVERPAAGESGRFVLGVVTGHGLRREDREVFIEPAGIVVVEACGDLRRGDPIACDGGRARRALPGEEIVATALGNSPGDGRVRVWLGSRGFVPAVKS